MATLISAQSQRPLSPICTHTRPKPAYEGGDRHSEPCAGMPVPPTRHANVINDLHAVAGAIDRLTEVIEQSIEVQDRQTARIGRAIDRTGGVGFDET